MNRAFPSEASPEPTQRLRTALPRSVLSSAAILLLATGMPSHGQTQDTQAQGPEVIAYGRAEHSAESGLNVLTRDQFQAGANNVSDVLGHINGVQLQPLGSIGDPVLVSIRGASGRQTRLLIDGIEVNQGQYGSYDLNTLPLNQIERIEILTGSSDLSTSGLTADQAIGGTINLVTSNQVHSDITRASASVGSWGTAIGRIDTPLWSVKNAAGTPVSQTRLSYEHQRSDNNYDYPVESPSTGSPDQSNQQPLENAEYRRNSLALTQHTSWFQGTFRLQDDHKALPSYQRNPKDNNARLDSRSRELTLSGNPTSTLFKQTMHYHWQLLHNRRNESFKDPQSKIGLGIDDDRYEYGHDQANLSAVLTPANLPTWQLGTGVQISEQTYRSQYKNDPDSQDCTSVLGNCDTFTWLDRIQWLYQANWRNEADTQQLQLSGQHTREQRGQRARDSQREKETASQASPSWQFSWRQDYPLEAFDAHWQLSYKRVTRYPSLYEQFGDHGLLQGSEDLQPELSRTLSLDTHVSSEVLSLPTQLTLSLFQRQLDNAVVPVYQLNGVGRYENTHTAQLNGLEWQLEQQLHHTFLQAPSRWYWSLSGSHYDSRIDDPNSKAFDGNQLPGTYHVRGLAKLGWQFGSSQNPTHQHHIQISAEIADDLYTGRANLAAERADQRRLINTSYHLQWPSGDAGLRVQNLTNKQYTDYTQRPATTRQWTLFLNNRF